MNDHILYRKNFVKDLNLDTVYIDILSNPNSSNEEKCNYLYNPILIFFYNSGMLRSITYHKMIFLLSTFKYNQYKNNNEITSIQDFFINHMNTYTKRHPKYDKYIEFKKMPHILFGEFVYPLNENVSSEHYKSFNPTSALPDIISNHQDFFETLLLFPCLVNTIWEACTLMDSSIKFEIDIPISPEQLELRKKRLIEAYDNYSKIYYANKNQNQIKQKEEIMNFLEQETKERKIFEEKWKTKFNFYITEKDNNIRQIKNALQHAEQYAEAEKNLAKKNEEKARERKQKEINENCKKTINLLKNSAQIFFDELYKRIQDLLEPLLKKDFFILFEMLKKIRKILESEIITQDTSTEKKTFIDQLKSTFEANNLDDKKLDELNQILIRLHKEIKENSNRNGNKNDIPQRAILAKYFNQHKTAIENDLKIFNVKSFFDALDFCENLLNSKIEASISENQKKHKSSTTNKETNKQNNQTEQKSCEISSLRITVVKNAKQSKIQSEAAAPQKNLHNSSILNNNQNDDDDQEEEKKPDPMSEKFPNNANKKQIADHIKLRQRKNNKTEARAHPTLDCSQNTSFTLNQQIANNMATALVSRPWLRIVGGTLSTGNENQDTFGKKSLPVAIVQKQSARGKIEEKDILMRKQNKHKSNLSQTLS